VRKLDAIDKKLMGFMDGKVLSVEAHVHELISQASDPKRLSKMYIGWAAYL
jgi:phosphatidylinositol kinase/protein kinase (PI-3  family)